MSKVNRRKTVYYVLHAHGCSLVKARTPTHAEKIARDCFGSQGSPYRVTRDRESVAWAEAMGAHIIE